MLLTEHLVQGVDVWLNTPRRPWEACGTSGMKVLVNGGINLSELDGWWAEAYTPEVGWALGDGQEHGDDPAWDAVEADALYDLLEREVIPEFYTRDEQGIPTAWVERMRESMARLTPRFPRNRAVREYTEQHYLPAASAYRRARPIRANRQADGRLAARAGRAWSALRFGEMKRRARGRTARIRSAGVSRRPCTGSGAGRALRRWRGRWRARAAGDAARPPTHRRLGRLRLTGRPSRRTVRQRTTRRA